MSRLKFLIIITSGFTIGILFAIVILTSSQNLNTDIFSKEFNLQSDAPAAGKFAPDFTISGVNQNNISLSDLRGKNVIITFWATWCAPCRLEMPTFQETYSRFGEDIKIVGINDGESLAEITQFINEFGLTFDIGIDKTGEVKEDYFVIGLPSTYFLDHEGKVVAVHIGAMTQEQLDGYLEIMGVNID